MKRLLLIALAASTMLSACGSDKSDKDKGKVDKKVLFGTMSEGIFRNEYFNIKIDFKADWRVDTRHVRNRSFGGTLFEGDYKHSTLPDYPLNLTFKVDRANPFARPNAIEKAEEEREGYDWLFEDEEIEIRDLKKTKIAGMDFVWSEVLILQDGDTSYINDYVAIKDKYYLIITSTVNSPEDKLVEQQFIQNIQKLK